MSVVQMGTSQEELSKQVFLDIRHVKHLQAQARKQQDVIKLTCINDKLVQLLAQANLFDKEKSELADFLSTNDDARFNTYELVVDRATRVHKLREEASVCAGEGEIAAASDNLVNDPDFGIDPTRGDPFDPGIEPPGYASPFR